MPNDISVACEYPLNLDGDDPPPVDAEEEPVPQPEAEFRVEGHPEVTLPNDLPRGHLGLTFYEYPATTPGCR